MIDHLFFDLPLLGLFAKFMIASTCLLGGVWVLEKVGIINTPDIAELAWKLAIAASFIAILPVSLASNNITIPIRNIPINVSSIDTLPATYEPNNTATTSVPPSYSVSEPSARSHVPPAARVENPRIPASNNNINESDSENQRASDAMEHPLFAGGAPDIQTLKNTQISPNTNNTSINASTDILLLTWAILALVALLALLISYRRAIASLGNRERVDAEHKANQALRALCVDADIRHVPFLSRSNNIDSPVCLPRREICLPAWAFEDMDNKALRSLIAHELAHMLRRDPAQIIFLQTLCRICFFQPLFALARRRLEDCAELAADEWAAKQLSSANAVAEALYTCAQKITQKRQIQWGLAMAGDKSILRHRVERLVKADAGSFDAAGTVRRSLVSIALAVVIFAIPSIDFATALSVENPAVNSAVNLIEADEDKALKRQERLKEHRLEKAITKREAALNAAERKLDKAARKLEQAVERQQAMKVTVPANINKNIAKHEREIAAATKALEKAIEAHQVAQIELSEEIEKAVVINALVDHIDPDEHDDCCNTISDLHLEDGNDGIETGNIHWSDGDQSIKASWDGNFTFSDDERSIKSIDEDALLQIRTNNHGKQHRIRFENEEGNVETTYWKDGKKQPLDKDGEKWLGETLQQLLQVTAIDMENRVARYLKKGGTNEALKRMADVKSDYVKRAFVVQLTKQAEFNAGQLNKLFQAIRNFESDYETRLTLITMLNAGLITSDNLDNALKAAENMESDYEMRLTLAPMIEHFTLNNKSMDRLLKLAEKIESDYELRLLLSGTIHQQKLSDAHKIKLLGVAKSLESDYELRLFVNQFSDLGEKLSEDITERLVNVTGAIEGDYERRLALVSILENGEFNKKIWLSVIREVSKIDGDYEKRLALAEIKDQLPDVKELHDAWQKAAQTISGDYERRKLLNSDDE